MMDLLLAGGADPTRADEGRISPLEAARSLVRISIEEPPEAWLAAGYPLTGEAAEALRSVLQRLEAAAGR
jgi:hypothetical protein